MIKNNRFKIKTMDGYRDFAGIAESSHNSHLEIKFSNNMSVKCSGEHIFWTYNNRIIRAKDLLIGFEIQAENGFYEISEINHIDESTTMFDIIEVNNSSNSFLLKNAINSHNCQFITFEKSLIDTDILDFYQTPEIITEINGFNIFKNKLEHEDALLIVTIDPSGGGEDNSVIQIWEIAPKKVYELASFVDADADASVLFDKLLWLQEYMKTQWDYLPDESLIIFERNGIGEGLAQILTHTEKAIENLEMPLFYDHKGKPGLHTTPSIKNKLALQFKNLVEFDKMKINDSAFIDELYGFIRTTGGSYAGKSGYHDDRVMAAFLLVYYLLNIFSDYAMGDFSVDNMMLVKPEEKIVNLDKTESDPALIYRKKIEENNKKTEAELIEEYKKREREMFAKQAMMGSSIVEEDDDTDEEIDIDKYDILSSQSL